MGLRGNPHTPTEILKLRGSKRAKGRAAEPQPTRGRPEHPDSMTEAEVAVWQNLCNIIDDMGLLTIADGRQLERYAKMYLQWRRVHESIVLLESAGGIAVVLSEKDSRATLRTAWAEARQLDTHLKQIENNFGLTPAARARLACLMSGKAKPEKDARESRFFSGATG